VAKDKKAKKAAKADKPKKTKAAPAGKKADRKAAAKEGGERPHPLEALKGLADHPLVSELLAAGALAAVAAVAEAGAKDPSAVRSADAAKKAGKAAAAAIGTRLLKEFSSGKKDKDAKEG
jgi:hypothetical protein